MKRFVLTREAAADLLDLTDYLTREAGVTTTRHVLAKIRRALTLLAGNPALGHMRADLTDEPVRFWPVLSWLIVYAPSSRPLAVVRVLHASRDIEAVLKR